jgi:predicted signal transduction protein with EAL and GGDEF domain
MQIAERVRASIEAFKFAHEESQPTGRLTISGGVAAYPADGISTTDLISHSDQALYRAKGNGRNRVQRYEGVQFGDADHDVLHDPGTIPIDDDRATSGVQDR